MTDYQRKVLRILYNFKSGRRRFPTVHELTVKTGKNKPDVMAALNALIEMKYIHWDDKSDTVNIVILEGWERESEKTQLPKAPLYKQENNTSMDYWTKY
ncbi:hypothetical protein [Paenibacillus polysaccharolyticus]|uniref:hypothetical protein n=1 Tax=Paenibacillus polysaccharolyticus TaxID=582692 RepID=UPI00280B6354|nr:hypothetical protein [Paenibacillus polysaccharolyticus]